MEPSSKTWSKEVNLFPFPSACLSKLIHSKRYPELGLCSGYTLKLVIIIIKIILDCLILHIISKNNCMLIKVNQRHKLIFKIFLLKYFCLIFFVSSFLYSLIFGLINLIKINKDKTND